MTPNFVLFVFSFENKGPRGGLVEGNSPIFCSVDERKLMDTSW